MTRLHHDAICADYRNGMTAPQVAAKHGTTAGTVYVLLSRHGVRLSPQERRERLAAASRLSGPHRAEVMRGRPHVGLMIWPGCPDHLRADYDTLSKYMTRGEARARLEAR